MLKQITTRSNRHEITMGKHKIRAIQANLGVFGHIPAYSDISRHIQPQSFTKCLILTLLIMWNSVLRQKFNICFSRAFASIDKIFILAGRVGTRLSFHEVYLFSVLYCNLIALIWGQNIVKGLTVTKIVKEI